MDDVISLGVGEPDFDTPRVDRRGRRREPARGPDPLHQQLRDARAAAGAVATTSSARYGVRYDPATRAPRHGRRVGGGRPGPARDVRPGRRGHPPRAVVRGVRPGDRLRRRRRRVTSRPASRTTSRSTRPPSRRPSRRGPRRCSWATRATRPAPSCPTTSHDALADIAVRHDLLVFSDEIYDRLAYGDLPPPGDSARCPGMRERTILHGRLLEGLRDDRLAGRLRARAGRRSSRASSRSTSTGSCRRRRPPRTRRSRRSSRARPTSSGWSAEYDRRRRMLVDGLNAIGLADVRAARRVLRLPADRLDRARPTTSSPSGCCSRSGSRSCPGSAFGPSGEGHVRMCYATSYEQLEEALQPDRAVRGAGADRLTGVTVGP